MGCIRRRDLPQYWRMWLAKKKKRGRHRGMGLTGDLGLRLLRATILSEDGRHKDGEDSNEPTPAQNKHGKDSRNKLLESGGLFENRRIGVLARGRNGCQRDGAPSGPDIYMDAPDTGWAMGGRRASGKTRCACASTSEVPAADFLNNRTCNIS